jgi:hypothetical protein
MIGRKDIVKNGKKVQSLRKLGKGSPATGTGLGRAIPQSAGKLPPFRLRQLCFPSSTAFSITGTGGSYTPATGLISGTTNTIFWSLYFRLADLSQANSDFGPMFDAYKIEKVRVHFFPQMVINYQGAAGVFSAPVYTVVDYDDSSVLSAFNNIFEYQNCEIHSPYKPFSVSLKPRIAINTGTGFENKAAGWIDMADQTVMHYGLKGVFSQLSASTAWNIVCEYIVELRQVR